MRKLSTVSEFIGRRIHKSQIIIESIVALLVKRINLEALKRTT